MEVMSGVVILPNVNPIFREKKVRLSILRATWGSSLNNNERSRRYGLGAWETVQLAFGTADLGAARAQLSRYSTECESGHRRVAVVVSEAQAFGSVTPCRPFVDGWPFCVVPALG
jgi:hypothetical protein